MGFFIVGVLRWLIGLSLEMIIRILAHPPLEVGTGAIVLGDLVVCL